jgi:hypothetical protein
VSQKIAADRTTDGRVTESGEVRVTEYAGRVVRHWYIVVAAVVVGILLVALNTVSTGKQVQAQATVFLGQPLTPSGGSALTSSINANPSTASARVRSTEAMSKAAKIAGIKSASVLRSHTSVTVVSGSSTKGSTSTSNINITVLGPWNGKSVTAAARSLSDTLIAFANTYQKAKIDLLDQQIATDQQQITNLQNVIDRAQKQLDAMGSNVSTPEKATVSATLLSTIATAGSRVDEISSSMTNSMLFRTTAQQVESAGYIEAPAAEVVTPAKRRSSLIVGAFTGLIVGVILALAWDALRHRRPRRGAA